MMNYKGLLAPEQPFGFWLKGRCGEICAMFLEKGEKKRTGQTERRGALRCCACNWYNWAVRQHDRYNPPILIVCAADESADIRIKMDVNQGGKLVAIEENWTVLHLPSRIDVRITDADGKTKTIPGT